MPNALFLVADGSEEIEFVTPYDGELYSDTIRNTWNLYILVLTRAGFEVASVGVDLKNEGYAQ